MAKKAKAVSAPVAVAVKPAQAAVVKPTSAAQLRRKAMRVKPAPAPLLVPAVAQQPAAPATVAKLTKRQPQGVLVGQVLVATGKPVRVRAPHVAAAWAACVAALPCTATQLAQLPALAHPQCVSPQGFISYMVRRGYLMPKA